MKRSSTQTAKTTKSFFTAALILAVCVPSLASAKVDSHPADVDLQAYQTYSWTADASELEPMELRIRESVDQHLQASGLERVETDGDLDARLATDAWTEVRFDSHPPMTVGPRASRWAWRHGIEVTEIREIDRARFEISLIDAESETVVWSGSAEGTPRKKMEKSIAKMEKATAKLFEDFGSRSNTANSD